IILNANGEYFIGGLPFQSFTLTARAEGAVAQASLPPSVVSPVDLTLPNQAPVIHEVTVTTLDGRSLAYWPPGMVVRVNATVDDVNNDPLHFLWRPAAGSGNGFVSSDSSNVLWTVPAQGGIHYMYLKVSDGRGGYASARVSISNVPLFFSGLVSGDDLQ